MRRSTSIAEEYNDAQSVASSPTETIVPSPTDQSIDKDSRGSRKLEESDTSRSLNIKEKKGTALYIDWEEGDIHHPFNWSLSESTKLAFEVICPHYSIACLQGNDGSVPSLPFSSILPQQ